MNTSSAISSWSHICFVNVYRTQENFGGGKYWWIRWIMSYSPKFSLPTFGYTENVFGICTDCSLFAKFFLANSFYLNGWPKFSRVPTVLVLVLKYFLKVLAFYLSTSPKTMACTCTCTSTNVKVLVLYLSTFKCTLPHAWYICVCTYKLYICMHVPETNKTFQVHKHHCEMYCQQEHLYTLPQR